MALLHEVRDMDTHFVIDPITRVITNPNSAKNKLMMGDHNSEIYTFELPKVVEGHDMSLCNQVRIHYNDISADKANASKDVYTVADMHIDSEVTDTLVFSWLISGNATKYAGLLSFRIQFLCIDASGEITYKWHTEVFKGITISDGFDNTEAVVEEYSDVIAEWEARLDALEQIGADWNAAEGEPGHVLNRTHWVENGMVEIPAQGEWMEIDDMMAFVGNTVGLEVDKTYVVNWDGTDYECVARDLSSFTGGEAFGALLGKAANMGFDDTGEPFAMMDITGQGFMLYGFDGASNHTFTIHHKAETIHKLDGKFLPDNVAFVEKGILLGETDAVETTDPNFGKCWLINKAPLLTVGETYTVIYNGVPYDCVCQSGEDYGFASGAFVMGNAVAAGGADTGEPFAMMIMYTQQAIVSLDLTGAESVRIGIQGRENVLNVFVDTSDPSNHVADRNGEEIWQAARSGKTVLLHISGIFYTFASYIYDGGSLFIGPDSLSYSSGQLDGFNALKGIIVTADGSLIIQGN